MNLLENNEITTGKIIANLRKRYGYTQKELSQKMNIPWKQLSDYERGITRVNDQVLKKLAIIFNISSDEILGLKVNYNTTKEQSLKIMKRLNEIEKLSLNNQKFILRTLDSLIRDAKLNENKF